MPKTPPSYHRGGSNQTQANYIVTSTEGQVHISRSSEAQPLYTEKTAAIENPPPLLSSDQIMDSRPDIRGHTGVYRTRPVALFLE